MNEKTSTMTNETSATNARPRTTFYHANGKGTGSAIRFELIPARPDADGYILATIAPQTGCLNTLFDWSGALSVRLDRDDLAEILYVLRGIDESIAYGKGIFHRSATEKKIIKLSHQIEPFAGYALEVNMKFEGSEDFTTFRITFKPTEALALMLAIEHAMTFVCFGVPANA